MPSVMLSPPSGKIGIHHRAYSWRRADRLVIRLGTYLQHMCHGRGKCHCTTLEKWLDSGVFGKHALDGNTTYKNLNEEQEALVAAMYTPVVLESDFDIYHDYDYAEGRAIIDAYASEFTLLLPGYQPGESTLQITHHAPGRISDWGSSGGSHYASGGALIHYRHFIPKSHYSKWQVEYSVKYRPSKYFEKDLILDFKVEHLTHLGIFD